MAAFVIDASATLPWCFADEATPATNQLLTRLRTGDEAIVPPHWPLEVANALLIAIRRERISVKDAQQFLDDLEVLPIQIDTAERNSLGKRSSRWRSSLILLPMMQPILSWLYVRVCRSRPSTVNYAKPLVKRMPR